MEAEVKLIKQLLEVCSSKELQEIESHIAATLSAEKAKQSPDAIFYDEVVRKMRTITDRETNIPKFSARQLEGLKPWRMLSAVKRKQFHQARLVALDWFREQGMADNSKTAMIMISMIANSPYMDTCSVDSMIEALSNSESLTDDLLPGWLSGSNMFADLTEVQ